MARAPSKILSPVELKQARKDATTVVTTTKGALKEAQGKIDALKKEHDKKIKGLTKDHDAALKLLTKEFTVAEKAHNAALAGVAKYDPVAPAA